MRVAREGGRDDVALVTAFATAGGLVTDTQELTAEFDKLVEAQRELLVKNEFDRIYTTAGASGMNAFTTEDITRYFINVPANKLELWM